MKLPTESSLVSRFLVDKPVDKIGDKRKGLGNMDKLTKGYISLYSFFIVI